MDTIADFLTRIRNAGMAKHETVDVSCSHILVGIASVLEKTGYIRGFKVADDGLQGIMRIYLRYNRGKEHVISKIKRMSRPGRRLYKKWTQIPSVRSGYGLAIFSTNKGIMSGEEASKSNLGGEFLCQLW